MTNKNIKLCVSYLAPQQLDLVKSSARRRFIRVLNEYVEDYNLEAKEIIKQFNEKKPDGSDKIIDNVPQYTKENRKKADAKFKELNNLNISINWQGEEKDKETIASVLQEELDKIKSKEKFDDETFEFSQRIEEIITELKQNENN